MEDKEEESCKHYFIGDEEELLSKAYEELRKKEAELAELKAQQRLLEKLVEYLEINKEE